MSFVSTVDPPLADTQRIRTLPVRGHQTAILAISPRKLYLYTPSAVSEHLFEPPGAKITSLMGTDFLKLKRQQFHLIYTTPLSVCLTKPSRPEKMILKSI